MELSASGEYYPDLIPLNSGRNCLKYILLAGKYRKLYLPAFSCDVLLEPLQENNIAYAFYGIDENLMPIIDFETGEDEAVLVINYFGLLDEEIGSRLQSVRHLIIDNSQAFYSTAAAEHMFYSPRKFFGVPDGGYLKTSVRLENTFETDSSADRAKHLLIRLDSSAEKGYSEYVKHEQALAGQEMKWMSPFTRRLLGGIAYREVGDKRRKNYQVLKELLGDVNELKLIMRDNAVPLCYPLLISRPGLRAYLIEHKIYVPNYWPGIAERFSKGSVEEKLEAFLLPLPVDQRYDESHMRQIIDVLMKKLKSDA